MGRKCFIGITLAALLTGFLSGLLGAGGGFLIIPTLLFLTTLTIQQAIATSLVIITTISTSGFISYAIAADQIDFNLLGQIAMGGLIGMTLGLITSKHIAGPNLQKVFAVLMLIMAGITLLNQSLFK